MFYLAGNYFKKALDAGHTYSEPCYVSTATFGGADLIPSPLFPDLNLPLTEIFA